MKKNEIVKEYVSNHILEKTQDMDEQNVAKVLELLAERFARTSTEKVTDVFEQILDFKMKEDKTYEQYRDRCQTLIIDCDIENVFMKGKYLMYVMFVEKAKDRLNTEEVRRLRDAIEQPNEDKTDRIPKTELEVVNCFMQEYKHLKIENNWGSDSKTNKGASNVNYVNNQSHWIKWNNFNNLKNFKDFSRSYSQPGMWRTKSENYQRVPDRTPSRGPPPPTRYSGR